MTGYKKFTKFALLIGFAAIMTILAVFTSVSDAGAKRKTSALDSALNVPPWFPEPVFPADNPYSSEKAELGRKLFYEKMLSKDGSMKSCSHCHRQENAFAGNVPMALGFMKEVITRNALPHQNVVYRKQLLWDGREPSLEHDAYASMILPFLLASDSNELVKKLNASPAYPQLFEKAFGKGTKITLYYAARAIATFQRTLISGNSAYDRYVNGDSSALSESQKRGMTIFFSEKGRCSVCHSGIFFTDSKFHNTGFVTHYFDRGLFEVTKNHSDRGKFLTPSLRNVAVTAPYMHNGEIPNLEKVVEHYSHGGRAIVLKDTLIKPLNLTFDERKDLVNFLKSLTDSSFLKNPKFSDPNLK